MISPKNSALKNSIQILMRRENLDSLACRNTLQEIVETDANPLQTAAFLVLLRSKTETPDELAGMIAVLKKNMIPLSTKPKHKILDIVGTGGDGANTINISTGSAILAASCGVKIAKHGNRAVSSLSGSADVLEALGIKIDLSPEKISASIDKIGIGFCFSPNFHPAMRKLSILRKQLNIPTTFNLLGPLLNPANPAHFLLGVFDKALLMPMAQTLQQTGSKKSVIVCGAGLDEISCAGSAKMIEITPTTLKKTILHPEKFGFSLCSIADLKGGNAQQNAGLLLAVFSGEKIKNKKNKKNKAIAETLILNAATALYLYGLYPSIRQAIPHARENLENHAALRLLKNWIEFSHD